MKFHSRTIIDEKGFYCREAILLSDTNDVIFHLRVPQDAISAWLKGFLLLMKTSDGSLQCQRLVQSADQIRWCNLGEEAYHVTFWKIIYALQRFLAHSASASLSGRQNAQQAIKRFLKEKINFRTVYDKKGYYYSVLVNGKIVLDEFRPLSILSVEEASQNDIREELWLSSLCRLYEKNTDTLHEILIHYDLLYEAVAQLVKEEPQTASFILRSFSNFSKALLKVLDQFSGLAPFLQKIPDLCAFIIKNEYENFEEQKYYLERLLKCNETPAAKFERLESIVQDAREDAKRNPTTNGSRLMKIIGPISDYYLRQYDLDRAAGFWDFVEKKDWLLSFILSYYRSPLRYAFYAILFMVLTGASMLIHDCSVTGMIHKIFSWLSAGLLSLAPGLVLAGLILILWRFLKRSGVDYVELFMPRLLGAIVVGLSILLLEDVTWKIGLQIKWPILILVCIAVYELSFIYIFIDVHKTLRLMPLPPEPKNQKPLGRSIRTSVKVFLIGFCGAFLAVLFSSGLLYQAALSSDLKFHELIADGLILQVAGVDVFGFFPKLVILWTGLTLFIGAFVQLIWQDRRITSPL